MPGAEDLEKQKAKNDSGAAGSDPDPENGGGGSDPNNDPGKEAGADQGFKTLDEANAEIKKLRKENADRRVKSKAFEDELKGFRDTMGKMKTALGIEEEKTPEEIASELKGKTEALELELAFKDLCIDHGIAKEDQEYFRFLLTKKFDSLEENAELSDDDVTSVLEEVRKRSAPAPKNKSTSADDGNGGGKPPAGKSDVTVEQFAKMNTGEKSQLYQKNPGLYNTLFAQANEKRLL